MHGYPIPRRLFAVGLVLLAALGAGVANLAFASHTVTIRDGSDSRTVQTRAATVGGALQAAGIALFPEDLVQPPVETALSADAQIIIQRSLPVEITEDGVSSLVRTRQERLATILAEAGRTVAAGDIVYIDGQPFPSSALDTLAVVPHSIVIQRLRPVTIVAGETTDALTSAALTVGDALTQAGIPLFVADGVEPSPSSQLAPGLTIRILRSVPVTVEVDGRTLQTRTHHSTVAEVLTDAGLALIGDDYVVPDPADPPPADGSAIRIVRVVEQMITETRPLAYETQFQAADLEIDTSQVIQAGAYGTTATRIRVRIENGVEVKRTPGDTWTAIAARPQIIAYGTQIVIRSLDTPEGPLEYWRAVRMYATSYSAARSGTPRTAPWYGRTRSGKTLTVGMAAIDLRVMPLGTRLYVPNYGRLSAEDTGGGVKGKMIDLGYDDWNFINWHQYVMVYFLTPVPPADQIKWVIP